MTKVVDPAAIDASKQYGEADSRGPTLPVVAESQFVNDEPDWVNLPPEREPSHIVVAGAVPKGANGTWKNWDGTAPLKITLPSGEGIRSLWFRLLPQGITIWGGDTAGAPQLNPGAGVTTTNQGIGEVVPIPTGIPLVTLVASQPFGRVINIYATSDVLPPSPGSVAIANAYPLGASPFVASSWVGLTSNAPVLLGGGSMPAIIAGQFLYITAVYIKGFELQPNLWTLTFLDADGTTTLVPNGEGSAGFSSWENMELPFNPAVKIGPYTKNGTPANVFTLDVLDTPMGNFKVSYTIAGYIL